MRLGVHLGYFMEAWGDDPLPLIPRARAAGCEVVEISLYSKLPEQLKILRRTAEAEAVELTFTTGLQPQTDISSADPAVQKAGIEYLCRCVEQVSEAGGHLLSGVIFGCWGARSGNDFEGRRMRVSKGLAQVMPLAEQLDVDLGIEPINRYETDLVTTLSIAVEIARKVDSPRLGILLDLFHAQLEEPSLAGAIAEAGSYLKHIHLADNHRGLPGTGSFVWEALLHALEERGYQGRAVIEAFTHTGTPVARDTATWANRGSENPDLDLKKSLDFLRGGGW